MSACLYGQEVTQGDVVRPMGGSITKVITLKYPDRVNTGILDGIGLNVKRADNLVVITGQAGRVDTAEAILHQLDTPAPPRSPLPPPKNIQLTAYLVIASAGTTAPQGTPVPKDIEAAVTQVSSMFSYRSFSLLDAIIMRTTDNSGAGSVNGVVAIGSYRMSLRRISITAESSGDLFHISNFDLNMQISRVRLAKEELVPVDFVSDIDVKDGQKAVVGKANFDGASDALIVILTAKVVE
jgi:hypothetical protein